MSESFLQYIWKYRLFDAEKLCTTTGEKVIVESVGIQNTDAGPDFFDARVRIGDTLWAGNVEVHKSSSDWMLHQHHCDKAYDNVVLHIVDDADVEVRRTNGFAVPTAILPYAKRLSENYGRLLENETWIPCASEFYKIDVFVMRFWTEKLAIRRLERKALDIEHLLQLNCNSWEETFYQLLARSFGARVNAEPFELLARSLPQTLLAKNKDKALVLEALFFGQAGFLAQENPTGDDYFESLKQEYIFLQKKYGLKPLEPHLWKFLRLRPANFPTVRLAQLAFLVYNSVHLFSAIKEAKKIEDLMQVFDVCLADGYWVSHYNFFKESKPGRKSLGKTAVYSLLINAVVPILFAYGRFVDSDTIKNRALLFWDELPPEKNAIVDGWSKLGMKLRSAYESQALIELKNNYCTPKKCLQCELGNKIIVH